MRLGKIWTCFPIFGGFWPCFTSFWSKNLVYFLGRKNAFGKNLDVFSDFWWVLALFTDFWSKVLVYFLGRKNAFWEKSPSAVVP